MSIITLKPTPSDDVSASSGARRLASLKGAKIGVLYNAKPKASDLLTSLAEILMARYGAGEILSPVRTEGVYHPSKAQFDALVAQADFVLIGLGDCGSCSACSVQVATDFERAGVPAVALCTEPFLKSGQAMAARQGLPEYEFITVPHPLQSLTLAELRGRAELAVPQLISILCKDTEVIRSEAKALSKQWSGEVVA
jgi:hypothetical protein